MATRRALVRDEVSGEVTELPVGDTLAGAGGGGSATITQAVINVPSWVRGYAEIIRADASVSTSSVILANLAAKRDAENDAEQVQDDNITLLAEPEAGQIRFILQSDGYLSGDFLVNYQVFT
ncbi:MAG: hypothetical protein ACRDBG_25530 [Waterburya sp.]